MRHPIDIIAMFAAIWLLASMVLDAVTPKELTAVMIAIAIGPAVVIPYSPAVWAVRAVW